MTAQLRPPNFSLGDSPEQRTRRLIDLSDDLRQWSAKSPRVKFVRVRVDAAGEVLDAIAGEGEILAVSVAEVVSGTVTGAPFVDWTKTPGRVGLATARGVYGVTGPAVLVLKVEA